MSHIAIDTNDLSSISNGIDSITAKIDNLKNTIDSKFGKAKERNLYLDGFKKISSYLEKEKEKTETLKTKINKYKDDIEVVERSYSDKFGNAVLPDVQSNDYSLVFISTPIPIPTPDTVPETAAPTPSPTPVPTTVPTTVAPIVAPVIEPVIQTTPAPQTTPPVTVENRSNTTTNNNVVNKPVENKPTNNQPVNNNNQKENIDIVKPVDTTEVEDDNLNIWGALAGAAGVVGAGSLAAVVAANAKGKKESEEDEDEEEEEDYGLPNYNG